MRASEPESWSERIFGFLKPTEFANLILYIGFAAGGLMVGLIFGAVLVAFVDRPPVLILEVGLTGAGAGLLFGVIFIGVTEKSVSMLWGHGRKVDQKVLAFEELMEQAVAFQRNHRYADAIDRFREILRRNLAPRPEGVWYRIGIVEHELRRDYKRAAYAYRKAIALLEGKPESAQEFSREATLLRECTTRLEGLSPRLQEVHSGALARRTAVMDLVAEEDLDEAREHTLRLVQDNPEDAENHFLRGYVLAKTGQRQLAIEQYRAAVEIDPAHTRALYNLAATLDVTEDVDEAIVGYERYLEAAAVDPDEAEWIDQARMQLDRLRAEVDRRVLDLQGVEGE